MLPAVGANVDMTATKVFAGSLVVVNCTGVEFG